MRVVRAAEGPKSGFFLTNRLSHTESPFTASYTYRSGRLALDFYFALSCVSSIEIPVVSCISGSWCTGQFLLVG